MPNGMARGYQSSAREQCIRKIDICVHTLLHAVKCSSCSNHNCRVTKRVIQHSKNCQRNAVRGCRTCKQLVAICTYHAKKCKEKMCPLCSNIKLLRPGE
ncbi:histone lysine acetyltransferase CREBBP [Drosophila biarmipes]|uniref:histone lysine acetyltransferase CREBBP n=1 Tax=Drosophila biarmipes TaxID=125945 RepID=UPI001CDAF386|nr:histone lysine acetyltransferase CREBBP [Drosophila biarmipes]